MIHPFLIIRGEGGGNEFERSRRESSKAGIAVLPLAISAGVRAKGIDIYLSDYVI